MAITYVNTHWKLVHCCIWWICVSQFLFLCVCTSLITFSIIVYILIFVDTTHVNIVHVHKNFLLKINVICIFWFCFVFISSAIKEYKLFQSNYYLCEWENWWMKKDKRRKGRMKNESSFMSVAYFRNYNKRMMVEQEVLVKRQRKRKRIMKDDEQTKGREIYTRFK